MENIIAKLLQDFECGKMNRRQLIQSIAAVAAVAGGAGAASAEGSPVFKAVAVNHISYQVADYAKTRDFYARLLGMKVSHDDGKQCYMAFGDSFLLPRNVHAGGKGPAITPPHVDHIAYTIDDWNKNKVEAELKKFGLDPRPDTDDSFHVKDPDGFNLQISGKNMKP